MNTTRLVAQIEDEIARLQRAKALLTGVPEKRRPGRPAKVATKETLKPVAATAAKRGLLSAEGRERIAAAQKLRWAKSKRAAKKAARAVAVVEAGKASAAKPVVSLATKKVTPRKTVSTKTASAKAVPAKNAPAKTASGKTTKAAKGLK